MTEEWYSNSSGPEWRHAHILCPHCDSECGMEVEDGAVASGTSNSPSGLDRSYCWTEIRGWCSACGHGYAVVLTSYKGMLVLSSGDLGGMEEPIDWRADADRSV